MGNDAEPATFVLIHGGGGSSWDWHLVEPELRGYGHEVIAVDMPIEDDRNGIAEYADAVVAACAGRPRLVVVAHSFGGLVAPVVCARTEARLMVLVTAMIPEPAESPAQWWSATGHDELGIAFGTPQEEIDVFYNGVPEPLIAASHEHARDQGGGKWDEPSPLQAWPDVPTRYLLCRDDRLFPPAFARAHVAERLGITPDEIDGGHMIALARPRALAERLHLLWNETRESTGA
ncbi:alpha/beta hydrolase [Glycomyces sp. TRM65418]|uniref:alpha/beta fold hydrolase n=1 Tax=Glycomyces sp. TRM65418 TaxID=2867006 RepID=UPI001CE4FDBB|nr:alpha/beta hydrolase [Glycomyces sp. TRM65418]MCC3765848.1 alpha/beta hydrolase [Glycomyces sp. TRM65418]QZD55433.1 alpha/beta hydrolase [Glycomyces sp. TRM65418]